MSDTLSPLLIGKNDTFEAVLLPALGNRYGLITGATGTGKTVTLQRLAEQFSAIGVPVFMADVLLPVVFLILPVTVMFALYPGLIALDFTP